MSQPGVGESVVRADGSPVSGLGAFSWTSWPGTLESLTQPLSRRVVEGPVWTVPLSQPGNSL